MPDQPIGYFRVVHHTSPFVNLKEVLVDAGIVKSERAATALIKRGGVSVLVMSTVQERAFVVRMAHAHEFVIGAQTTLLIHGRGCVVLEPIDRSHVEED